MSGRIKAKVKSELLVWARESAKLSLERAVAAAPAASSLNETCLQEWEAGRDSPTVSQLRILGKIYKRPIAVFFLSEPPQGFAALRELRRLPHIQRGEESPELMAEMRSALYHREVALEMMHMLGDEPVPLDFEIPSDEDVEETARRIRTELGFSWADQQQCSGPHAALSGWRSAVEARSALVLQSGNVSLEEMRGLCFPNQPLPVIVLNSKDAPHGRIFTLLHEWIHVLLHANGENSSRQGEGSLPRDELLEVKANALAAAVLLPSIEFSERVEKYPEAMSGDDDTLRRFANHVKASPHAILRRMLTLEMIDETLYAEKLRQWGNQVWYTRQSSGAVQQSVLILAREGRTYTNLVLTAFQKRVISTSAACDYLSAKATHFSKLRDELCPSFSPLS